MAEFQKVTSRALPVGSDLSIVGVGGTSAAKSGGGIEISNFRPTSVVGAMGDSAAKSGGGIEIGALKKATSTVGSCGDNAAKSGTGA